MESKGYIEIVLPKKERNLLKDIIDYLIDQEEFEVRMPSLDDIFIEVVKNDKKQNY